MRIALFFFAVLLLASCSAPAEDSELAQLEKAVADEPTNANVSQLIVAYDTWLDENRAIDDQRKEVLLKKIALSEKHNLLNAKLKTLQSLASDYHGDPDNPARLIQISEIYKQLNRNGAAVVMQQAILAKYPTIPEAEGLRSTIGANPPPVDSIIADLADRMFNDEAFKLDDRIARQYVDACEGYALVNLGEPASAEYLHKAAETARTLGTLERALSIYDWIIAKHPNHRRASQALFLKAFTYDNDLRDTAKAGKYYREFLQTYPNDTFAMSAEFLLKHLGKDDSELLEALQSKEGE